MGLCLYIEIMLSNNKQIWDAGGYIITNPLDPQATSNKLDSLSQIMYDKDI